MIKNVNYMTIYLLILKLFNNAVLIAAFM